MADVYTFRNGKAIQLRAFADRRQALEWAGVGTRGVEAGPCTRAGLVGVALLATAGMVPVDNEHSLPYPDGFRGWQHVKSDVVGPAHPSFPSRGGIHHFYASRLAVEGYRTGKFPNGAVLVDEGLFTRDGTGPAAGILPEGERRSVEVMAKDDGLYKETGGWGFEHFDGTSKAGRLATADRVACFGCHSRLKGRDLVFTSIRPGGRPQAWTESLSLSADDDVPTRVSQDLACNRLNNATRTARMCR